MNSYRKVIPGADSFVAEMINTRHDTLLQSHKNGLSQIACIGRCTNLVENNSQRFFLLSQANHGLYEIVAKRRIQPCRTNHHRIRTLLQRFLLTSQFGRAIYGIRTRYIFFLIRDMGCTVEHIVRRHLHQPAVTTLCRLGQIARSHMIQFVAEFHVVLCLIDCCISRTVHNYINLMSRNEIHYCLLVADVQFCHVSKEILKILVFFCQQTHFITQLSVGSRH